MRLKGTWGNPRAVLSKRQAYTQFRGDSSEVFSKPERMGFRMERKP